MAPSFPPLAPQDLTTPGLTKPDLTSPDLTSPPAPTLTPPAEPANPLRVTGPVARWVVAGSALATSAFLAGYLYLVDPNNPMNAYPKCPMKALTGIDCPGCGGLRATNAMLHGDIHSAIDHNVLAVVLVPLMAYMLLRWVVGQFGKELPRVPWPSWSSWALPILLVAFTVLRAIPNQPFHYFNSETSS